MKFALSFLCCIVCFICSASVVLADDDFSQSLGEEASDNREELGSATSDTEAEPAVAIAQEGADDATAGLPRAENVDLKEVISEPLREIAPVLPPEQIQEGEPTEVSVERPAEAPAESVQPQEVLEPEVTQSIQLLGVEVLPGTATRLAWSAQDSLKGISIPTPVLVVHGSKPGPVLCLTGAVHGDELNGIEVVRQVLYNLDPEKLNGTVIGVPIVNLQGFIRASRYLSDRRDINRYFPGRRNGSSAARIANSFFTQVIQHCTYLVDIHTGSFRRTNLPQLRADLHVPKVAEMTRNLGPIVVLHSRGAFGSLRRAAVEAGILAVTVEAGEPLNVTLDAVKHGVQSIENFMHKMHMYSQPAWMWARETKPVYFRSRWVRSSMGGILLSDIRLGERVVPEQVLGVVTDPITNVATTLRSPIAGQVIGMALNQVMLPGFAAYHIGYQATVEEAATQDAGPDDYAGDDDEVDASGEAPGN